MYTAELISICNDTWSYQEPINLVVVLLFIAENCKLRVWSPRFLIFAQLTCWKSVVNFKMTGFLQVSLRMFSSSSNPPSGLCSNFIKEVNVIDAWVRLEESINSWFGCSKPNSFCCRFAGTDQAVAAVFLWSASRNMFVNCVIIEFGDRTIFQNESKLTLVWHVKCFCRTVDFKLKLAWLEYEFYKTDKNS